MVRRRSPSPITAHRHAPAALVIALGCSSPSSPVPQVTPGPPVLGDWDPPQVHVDQPYLQEVSAVVGALTDVRALALDDDGECHAVTAAGVARFDGSAWQPLSLPATRSSADLAIDGAGVVAAVGTGGAVVDGQAVDLPGGEELTFVAPRAAGGFWLAGPAAAGYWDGAYHDLYPAIGQPVRAMAELGDGSWLAATPVGVVTEAGTITTADGLPSNDVRSLAADPEGSVWAGTDAGLVRRDGSSGAWTAMAGADGLHFGDVTDLATDAEGTLLVSTTMGASRYHQDGTRRYYLGRIWLPSDDVRAMARAQDGTVWLATATGVARVEQRQLSLADKAARFDDLTRERHVRLGYTSTENRLETAGDPATFSNHDDDNDGQWTAMYLGAQCFRYAVTGEEQARANARTAAYALMKLEQVPGLEGFFARSIVPGDECEAKQQGAGEWHLSDDGEWCWKGDTSSDEFVGHMFGLSLFYDLVATADEQRDVADTIRRIVGGILDHGFLLLDLDGQVTRHGHFDPDWMETSIPAVFGDAGLNSAMILGGLHVAFHVTGERRFRDAFDYLARERGYADFVSRIEEINLTVQTNHDSEEMSFLALYTLMRYEDDRSLLARYAEGLAYLWEVQRPERNPEFNMMYAALARTDEYDLDRSVETLQKLPLDLVLWGLDTSQRWDRDEDPEEDRLGEAQNTFVFPYDERQAMRWAENPYRYRLPGDGHQESSGTFWLLPYWMARYWGVIR
ncbi:MAG: hypothetical protein JRI23_25760 [Deltaproteobacteria bacterium]|jgi:hypothetical protein|nr:hypothetical protein [Deltaproteobacteria bacterium]MBW2535434.1 hypothetical protein [Deltaproteobacteria bacterium]